MSDFQLTMLQIPEDLKAWANEQAQAAGCTHEEFLRRLLSDAREQQALLKKEIEEGLRELDHGKGIAGEAVMAELWERNREYRRREAS